MAYESEPELLVLHGVRLLGFADGRRVARRWGLDEVDVEEHLLDAEAYGWVSRSEFDGTAGWFLTDAGRRRNEDGLAAELDRVPGARAAVIDVHDSFGPVNEAVTQLCTAWQLADHDARGVDEALQSLSRTGDLLDGLERQLTGVLARFAGYHSRFVGAVERARDDPRWVAGIDVDSCHRIWFELHEDLVATLGLQR